MKIAKYIGDLLYDYECVVIPGLGGFLTNEKPASIHPVTHHFRPPTKQVLFNSFLKTNDGLLLNYIAREENANYKEAKEQLDHFVLLCNNALKEGKRINFHKVGYLYLNSNEQITFEQDSSVNFNAEAFGLGTFVSPVVHRPKAEEKLRYLVSKEPAKAPSKKEPRKPHAENHPVRRDKITTKKKLSASRRKSPYRTQLTFLTLLILSMLVGWGFMNKETVGSYYNNYSSVIPLFYSNPNAYLINNIDHVPISKISSSKTGLWIVNLFENHNKNTTVENTVLPKQKEIPEKPVVKKVENNLQNAAESSEKIKNSNPSELLPAIAAKEKGVPHTTVLKNKTETPVPVLKSSSKANPVSIVSPVKHYFILAGAFKNLENANRLVNQLKAKGFQATDAGLTPDGLHRVAFAVFEQRTAAEQQLLAIRHNENPLAWILEK